MRHYFDSASLKKRFRITQLAHDAANSLYTTPKLLVKRFTIISRLVDLAVVIACMTLTSHCMSIAPRTEAQDPWQMGRSIMHVLPQERPVLWLRGSIPVIGWIGSVTKPQIEIAGLSTQNSTTDSTKNGDPISVALGTTPRDLTIYPALNGRFQLLWIDQALPGEARLVGAVIDSDGQIYRGLTVISNRSVLSYQAVINPDGGLVTFWVEAATPTTPLYMQEMDGEGRPRQARRIALSARHPSATYDRSGILHVAWIEPEQLATIPYAAVPSVAALETLESAGRTVQLGVIRLKPDEAIESFGLGLDETSVYCIWGIVTVKQGIEPVGKIAGLSFPHGNSTTTRLLTTAGAESPGAGTLSLRWPVFSTQGSPTPSGLTIGLTMRTWDGTKWRDAPASAVILPGGIGRVEPVARVSDGALVGKTSLIVDPEGGLHMAWSVLNADGTAAIYYAETKSD
jgi:hypothetical protein